MNLSLGFFSVGRQFWQQTHAMHLQLNGLEKLGNRKNNICPFIFFSYLYICSSHPAVQVVQLCSQGSRKVKLFHVLSRARFSFFLFSFLRPYRNTYTAAARWQVYGRREYIIVLVFENVWREMCGSGGYGREVSDAYFLHFIYMLPSARASLLHCCWCSGLW